jgi:hydroxypyruvate reductase
VVEEPIDAAISLDDLVATYQALVLSGAPIGEINAIRKHLSAVKGGRMAKAAAPAQQVSILVSDVPDHQLDALASGPTMPDSSTVEQCREIAHRHGMLPQFPAPVRALFEKGLLEETPKADDAAFARSRYWPILSNGSALQAAADQAKAAGFAVEVDNSVDDWDYLLQRVRELRRKSPRVCLLSGGEVTVKVTGGGTGGRNQQFALYCAAKIAGENLCVLSAGTDGIDGNSPAAGAVADGTTMVRAQARGFSPEQALSGFNAYPLFESVGDAITTGPTGNNVRDLRVLLAW